MKNIAIKQKVNRTIGNMRTSPGTWWKQTTALMKRRAQCLALFSEELMEGQAIEIRREDGNVVIRCRHDAAAPRPKRKRAIAPKRCNSVPAGKRWAWN
jgi:hypothetical protein